eukprot:5493745-Pleurochrysis_carterae.AAC.1
MAVCVCTRKELAVSVRFLTMRMLSYVLLCRHPRNPIGCSLTSSLHSGNFSLHEVLMLGVYWHGS